MGNKKSTKKNVQPFEIGELDQYLFGQGNHYEIYQKMGAHKVIVDGPLRRIQFSRKHH